MDSEHDNLIDTSVHAEAEPGMVEHCQGHEPEQAESEQVEATQSEPAQVEPAQAALAPEPVEQAPEPVRDEAGEVPESADVAPETDVPQAAETPSAAEPAPEQIDPMVERHIANEVAVGVREMVAEQQPQPQQSAPYVQSPSTYVPQYPDGAHFARPYQSEAPEYPREVQRPVVDASKLRGPARQRSRHNARSFAFGLLGGLVGALVMACVLRWAGVIGDGSQTVAVQPAAPVQTLNITPESEDVTVAQAVAAKALPSVVLVRCTYASGSGVGSGVILDTDGNIITNYHVVEDALTITVTVGNQDYDAEVVGADASSDLAVIRADFEGTEVVPIEMGDSSELVVGDWVMTVGSPFGLDQSVSAGIVSSLYRSELMTTESGTAIYTNLIQVDAAINPGNSGGALVNSRGQLVGICTLFSSDTESFAGIGFAIPGNYAIDIASRIIAGEQVTHAYIGLSMQTVNDQNAEANNLSVNYGAYVAEVLEGGPAESVGIQVGDIVIAVGNRRVTSADSMVLEVRSHSIGETVIVTVMRGDERRDFEVTLGSDERLQELQAQEREQQRESEKADPVGLP